MATESKPNPMPKPQVGNETSQEVRERLNPTQADESHKDLPDQHLDQHQGAVEEQVDQKRPPTKEMGKLLDTDRAQAADEGEDGIDPADLITTPG